MTDAPQVRPSSETASPLFLLEAIATLLLTLLFVMFLHSVNVCIPKQDDLILVCKQNHPVHVLLYHSFEWVSLIYV